MTNFVSLYIKVYNCFFKFFAPRIHECILPAVAIALQTIKPDEETDKNEIALIMVVKTVQIIVIAMK